MAIKSLLYRARIDTVLRAHNCQASGRHRLTQGEKRLKVKNGRSWDHYCQACATSIIIRDIEFLEQLKQQLTQNVHAT